MNNKTEKQAKFGWRYFHLIDPAGSRINVVDHDTDIFGQTNSQYVTMVVKEPGKKPERFKGSKRAVWEHDPKKETGNFDFVFDNARLKGDISRYGSYPDISDIVLCDSAGTKSHWGIDLPYGVVKAELTTPEMIRPILGFGYRDRQWGDLLLQDWVKNWNWTYLANSALFSVVFDISSLNGERIYHAISGNERGIIRTAKPKMEPESSSVTSFAITLEKQIVIPNLLSASFALSPNNLMRSRINEEHPGFLANYLRWSVDAQASNGPQLNGIAEYMSIQRT